MTQDRAAEVAELSQKLVRVAELLETAEGVVSNVRAELQRLDLADGVAEDFDQLVIPSEVAERLQDALDQLAGELANRPRRPAAGAGDGIDRDDGLLQPADPAGREELRVRCPSCHRDFTSPVAGDARQAASAPIDQRTYTCPHCGHKDRYETWDHFVV